MIAPGEVWLVGAGPGDPDLLTRKAERLIRAASVVFYDALVGPDVLALARAETRLVSVGKRVGRHSKDQRTICALIIEAALAGERVVRLKGGDPSVFGRSMEELDACRAAGIPVRICPGITAAIAAAASLGTSLTLRGTARQVTFVTAHVRKGEKLDLDWASLAAAQTTLAVYMGKGAAPEVATQLLAHGLPGDTPVACIESASLPEERQFCTRLDLLPMAARLAMGDGPVILLIGAVAAGPARRGSVFSQPAPRLRPASQRSSPA
ncbi:uroporphyrinogen-III C-methyltransferase [Altererythrobacter lauratis]|uniref:uroporphyrinogen-III C-methyltransferase n=1 Tax=Alteraurantiacibacter lauratis TaxID=2054627 RepID=A0ABV7EJU7_9SPHN